MNKLELKFLNERLEACQEQIFHAELGIKFLSTKEGQELSGSNVANEEILKYQELIRRKTAEKNFMESLLV